MPETVRDSILSAMAKVLRNSSLGYQEQGQPIQEGQMGAALLGGKVDKNMLNTYAKDPTIGAYVGDAQKLMQLIDTGDAFRKEKARYALEDIYGINDYSNKSILK